MSAVLKKLPWELQPFENFHDADDVHTYFATRCLKYINRWFTEKSLDTPDVTSEADGPFIHLRYNGISQLCSTRASVADSINWFWTQHLLSLNQDAITLKPDELINTSLYCSMAPLDQDDEEVFLKALQIGRDNFWISRASDPSFTRKSFMKVRSIAALEAVFSNGNWSLGTGFIYRDLAFINQVDGGDEWLVIRKDAGEFESWSAGSALKQDPAAVEEFVLDVLAASAAQLKSLDYSGARNR